MPQNITETIKQTHLDLGEARRRASHIHEQADASEQARRAIADDVRELVGRIEQDEIRAALDGVDSETGAMEAQVTALRLEESQHHRKAEAQRKAYAISSHNVVALEKTLQASKLQVTTVYTAMLNDKTDAARFAMAELMVCLARAHGTPLAAVSPSGVFTRRVVAQNMTMASSDPKQLVNVIASVATQMAQEIGA